MNIFLLICCFCACNFPLLGLLNSLTLSGNPATFTVITAVAGSNPTNPPNNTSTSYTIINVLGATTIVGSLNSAMPTGITLKVQLAAPGSGTSTGLVTMTTTNQNLVTGIGIISLSAGNQITYSFSATVQAAPVASGSRTLTYTLQ
jgi:hypothetical protein